MHRKTTLRAAAFVAVASILSGCASYSVKPMPTLNPTAAANHAEKANLYIAAKAFRTAHECRAVFSDNLTGGGYIPVEVSLENMGRAPLILYRQNFELTTSHGEILSATAPEVVAEHFSNSVVGGALLTGVFGVAAAEHANHKRDAAFQSKGLDKTIPLANGQVVNGFLYFKGKMDKTLPAHLRVTFTHNEKSETITLPVG